MSHFGDPGDRVGVPGDGLVILKTESVILGTDWCSWGRTGAPGDGRVILGMDW